MSHSYNAGLHRTDQTEEKELQPCSYGCCGGLLTVLIFAFSAALAHGFDDCAPVGDVNGDGAVDLADHTSLAACMGGPGAVAAPDGCAEDAFARSDIDGDSDVDLHDAALLARAFGAAHFPYGPHRGNQEAELLAMDLSGELRAPDFEYERILGDLALIRAAEPDTTTVIDDPDYVPDQMLVGMVDGMPTAGFDALNDYYLVTDVNVQSFFTLVTFCDNLNITVLAAEYAALPEVSYGEPNWFIGTDDDIDVWVMLDDLPEELVLRYEIDDGFLDCFDGCDCHRVWVFDVNQAGKVTLVSFEEFGQPWCDF